MIIGVYIGKLLANVAIEKEKSALNERNIILTEIKSNAERTISEQQLDYRHLQLEKDEMVKVTIRGYYQ